MNGAFTAGSDTTWQYPLNDAQKETFVGGSVMRGGFWMAMVASFALTALGSGFLTMQALKDGADARVTQAVSDTRVGMVVIHKRRAADPAIVRPVARRLGETPAPSSGMPPCVVGQCQDV